MLPKITLVTTTLNAEKYLARAMTSVMEQDYPNLEYIVIDAGSTDATHSIIREFGKGVSIFKTVPGIGLYAGLQYGFDLGDGEIMGWLNADDILHRGALMSVGGFFKQRLDAHWVTGRATLIDQSERVYRIFDHCYRSRLRFLHGDRRWIQQESTYWRRSLWDEVGGLDTDLNLAGDFDLWFRFFEVSRLYQLDALIGAFRTHGEDQLSNRHARAYDEEVDSVIQRHRPISLKKYGVKKLLDSVIKKMSPRHHDTVEKLLQRLGLDEEIGLARRARIDCSGNKFKIETET